MDFIIRCVAPLTWAWIIIIGGLMIIPEGVVCIVCGPILTKIIGVISVLLGVAGLVANQRAVRS